MLNKNLILVIFENRIKAIDTILPLLMQLDLKKVEILFYIPNKKIFNFLHKNIFLYDTLIKLGKIIYFENTNNQLQNKFLKFSVFILINAFKFIVKILTNKLDIIYFARLKGKRNFLSFFRYNLFFCENDPYGNSKYIEKIKLIEKGIQPSPYLFNKENLILLSKDFYNLEFNKDNKNLKYWIYKNLKKNKIWLNYVQKTSFDYLNKEFLKNNLNYSKKINTVFLGVFEKDFGWCKEKNIMPKLLTDVIEALIEVDPETPIFFKPYDLTNLDKLNEVLLKFNFNKFVISYLHPMILGVHSKVAIANSSTAALGDLKVVDVPTIEYTHYSNEVLNHTNNKAIRPEWSDVFINHDKNKLKKHLINLICSKTDNNYKKTQSNLEDDPINKVIIERLNGSKKIKSFDYATVTKLLNLN